MTSIKTLAFTEAEYHRRLAAVRNRMAHLNLEAIMVCDPRNIRYLTGFHTYAYWDPIALIVTNEGDPIHFTLDFEQRNVEVRSWTSRWDGYTQWEQPIVKMREMLERHKLGRARIGIEKSAWFLTPRFYEAVLATLPEATWGDCSGIVERVRYVKSAEELVCIREAAKATIAGVQAAVDTCAEGRNENDIAAAVHQAMILAGSEPPAIPPLINAGFRSSLPHAVWAGKRLERGDLVFFELSGCVQGYHAPMCRVAVIGDCGEEQKRIASASIEAVEAALALVKPGVVMGTVDKAARDVLRKAGMDEYFRTPIGYPVGLGFPIFWGEQPANPMMLEGEQALLEEGSVFHMIPSLQNYALANQGGGHVTISSTIAITKDGYELLTDFPRKLFFK
jgi:Xaa-Pro dipeptidase